MVAYRCSLGFLVEERLWIKRCPSLMGDREPLSAGTWLMVPHKAGYSEWRMGVPGGCDGV
jgi:hypothetical protein